jgi:hypothetical protein
MSTLINPWNAKLIKELSEWKSSIILPPETGQYVVFEPDNKCIGSMMFYKEHNKWGAVNRCKYFNNNGTPRTRFYWCEMPSDPANPKVEVWDEDEYHKYHDEW